MISTELHSSLTPLTLESVKSQFLQWRGLRPKGQRIPSSLWEAVRGVATQHNYKHIASELKINPSRMLKKLGAFSPDPFLSKSSPFVEVPLSDLSSSSPKPPPSEQKFYTTPIPTHSIEVIRVEGTILKASGLNNKDLFSLVQNFLRP